MTAIILIALYILGCVLAYGRLNAQYVEDKELYGMYSYWTLSDFILISLSWGTFLFGIISYYADGDKYFIKF